MEHRSNETTPYILGFERLDHRWAPISTYYKRVKALEALVIICISHFRKVRIRAAPNPAQKSDPAPQHCVKNIVQCVSVQYTYTLYSIISMHVHVIVLVRVKIKKGLNF